jgi:hypothetical protein
MNTIQPADNTGGFLAWRVVSKTTQILLEAALLYMIVSNWRKSTAK